MAALQHATPWQDGTCTCRKQRPPKIGDIPRHTAVDMQQNEAPSSSFDTNSPPPNVINVPTKLEERKAPLQKQLLQQSSPSSSPANSPRSGRKREPLKESRRVSIEQFGEYIQLNQYKLMEPIGQGAYGIVKLAYNNQDDKVYAMKILSIRKILKKMGIFGRVPPKKEGQNSKVDPLRRIYTEIAVLKKLNHPNVVKLVEVLDDPEQDNLYLVFELAERGQVLQIPTDNPLAEDQAWKYFCDVILGIEYLHKQRIVHRDIKPENLLLGKNDQVQIADFGVCNEFNGQDDSLTSTEGTPAFAAPETFEEVRNKFSGRQTDIWSLGVTLYSFIYGQVPFKAGTNLELRKIIKDEPVKFPPKPDVSLSAKHLIKMMLIKDPHRRITLDNIKLHPWVNKDGLCPLPTQQISSLADQVTEEDIEKVSKTIPKLDTLILVKHMIKNGSFQHPFDPNKKIGERNPTVLAVIPSLPYTVTLDQLNCETYRTDEAASTNG